MIRVVCHATKRREEFLDAISYENRINGTPSKVEEFVFRNLIMKLVNRNGSLPAHLSVRMLSFSECLFEEGVYLTKCPCLVEIRIDQCEGVLKLVHLVFDRLVFKGVSDRKCILLEKSSAKQVLCDGYRLSDNEFDGVKVE